MEGDLRVEHDKCAANTAAFALVAEGWNELVQDALTPEGVGVCPVNHNSEIVYVVGDDDDVVGFIAFESHQQFKTAIEILSYVEPSSRRRGAYTAMFDRLKAVLKDRGINRLTSAVPIGCKSMLSAKKKFLANGVAHILEIEL